MLHSLSFSFSIPIQTLIAITKIKQYTFYKRNPKKVPIIFPPTFFQDWNINRRNCHVIPHNCYVFFLRQLYYKIRFQGGDAVGSATILSLLNLVNKNFIGKQFSLDQIYCWNLVNKESTSKYFYFLEVSWVESQDKLKSEKHA